MCFDPIYSLFPNSFQMDLFLTHPNWCHIILVIQDQFMLLKYSWMCSFQLESGQLTRGHVLRENYLYLSHQLTRILLVLIVCIHN